MFNWLIIFVPTAIAMEHFPPHQHLFVFLTGLPHHPPHGRLDEPGNRTSDGANQ